MWNGRKVKTQRVLDEVYSALRDNYGDVRQLWDLSSVKKWGAYQATERQMEMVRRFVPDSPNLTKLEANQILTRCFYQ